MMGKIRRTVPALAAASLIGAVVVSVSADNTASRGGRSGETRPSAALRAAAQAVLDGRASLLSTSTRIALGMAARGDTILRAGAPTAPDPAALAHLAAPTPSGRSGLADDASAASAPANTRVNNPAEDTHQVDQTTQSEPMLAVSGSHVAVGFNDSQNALIQLVAGDNLTGYAYSDNGGASFTDGGSLPNATGMVNLGDPWLATSLSGTMYFSSLALNPLNGDSNVVVAHSGNGGHTWTTPVAAGPSPNAPYFADKDALAAGVGPNHSGSAVYAAWDDISFPGFAGGGGGGGGGGGVVFGLAVSHSSDGGQTWHLAYADQIPPPSSGCSSAQYIGANPLVDNQTGTLYVAAERIDFSDPTCGTQPPTLTFSERVFKSSDGGNTFSPGVLIGNVSPVPSPFVLGPTSAMRDAEFPTMALRNGTLYVAWNDSGSSDGSTQIKLATSSDGGSTWSSRFVTSGAGQRIQPALSADAAGLHLLYYRINSSLQLDAVARDSADASHWSAHTISSQSFPGVENLPQFDPFIAYTYMGDYIGNVSDGTRRYYVWGDNRDIVTDFLWPAGRHDPDVFFAAG